MVTRFSDPESAMRHALALAARGLGTVEPNPPVGALVVDDSLALLGEGCHREFGGPHAEIHALQNAGDAARGATLFVTLEPCCHRGKTGPCTEAIVHAGIRKVVVGIRDPSTHADGQGIAKLRSAGIEVEVGCLTAEITRMLAPFIKRVTTGLPWVHAKWAMSLDGKIATHTGASRWISSEAARKIVHCLRGRMDAVVVGGETARKDDPLLTPRPPGPRTPARIVVSRRAQLKTDSQLVRTVEQAPLLVIASTDAPPTNVAQLRESGIEVLQLDDGPGFLQSVLKQLGSREMTNILIEGGADLLGAFFDADLLDEIHVFIAPRIIGGAKAVSPLAGRGLAEIPTLPQLESPEFQFLEDNIYIHARLNKNGN